MESVVRGSCTLPANEVRFRIRGRMHVAVPPKRDAAMVRSIFDTHLDASFNGLVGVECRADYCSIVKATSESVDGLVTLGIG